MRLFCLLLSVLAFSFLQAQNMEDFITDFYFEDSEGRKDTLTIIDPVPGVPSPNELNIANIPLDSFDIRIIEYRRSSPSSNPPLWDCSHLSGDVSLTDENLFNEDRAKEFKEYIQTAPKCDEERFSGLTREFFIPIDSEFPITISWDSSLYEDSCRLNSFISEIPFPLEQIRTDSLWCEDRINHPRIMLRNSNSIILEEPNFISLRRMDSTVVSVYSLFVSSTSFAGDIIDSVKEADKRTFDVFPNPNTGSFTLDGLDNYESLSIFDIQGRLIKTYPEYTTQIEIESKGLRILKVEMGDGRIYSKKVTCY